MSGYDPYATSDPYRSSSAGIADPYTRFRQPIRRPRGPRVQRPVAAREPEIHGYSLPRDDDERRQTALEWIIDRLSTGQYVSANVLEDLTRLAKGEEDAWDSPILKGLTGERRGDMTNVMFGGSSSAEGRGDIEGWMPVSDERGGGRRFLRGVGGFIGNVLVDPITYIGAGATAATKAAAQGFAKATVKQAMRQLRDPAVARRIFGERAAKATTPRLQKKYIGAAPMQQYRSRVYNDAYREALATPSDVIRQRYLRRLEGERADVISQRDALFNAPPGAEKVAARKVIKSRLKEIDDDLAKVRDDDVWNMGIKGDPIFSGFRALGEQAWRFMGREIAPTRRMAGSVRQQVHDVANAVRHAAREMPVVKPFMEAWWASRTHGAVGQVIKAIGLPRSQYQTMLRQTELSLEQEAQDIVRRNLEQVDNAFKDVTDETKASYVKLMSAAWEHVGARLRGAQTAADRRRILQDGTRAALADPAVRSVIPAEHMDETLALWSRVASLTNEWHGQEARMAAAGLIKNPGFVSNYLPIKFRPTPGEMPGTARKRGGMVFSPLLRRNIGFNEARTLEARKMAGFFGMDEDAAVALIDQNAGALVSDPQDRKSVV